MEQVKDLFGYLSVKDVEVKDTLVELQQVLPLWSESFNWFCQLVHSSEKWETKYQNKFICFHPSPLHKSQTLIKLKSFSRWQMHSRQLFRCPTLFIQGTLDHYMKNHWGWATYHWCTVLEGSLFSKFIHN